MARRKTHAPLNVLINNRLVGRLEKEPSGAVSFQYDQSWLDWQHAFAASLSLPGIQGEPLDDEDIGRLLADLKGAPLGIDPDAEFRISIAGARRKLRSCATKASGCGRTARRRRPISSSPNSARSRLRPA